MIEFEIPEELKSAVSKFGIEHHRIIKIIFTEEYDKKTFHSIFNKRSPEKSLHDVQSRLEKAVPKLSNHHFNLIEDTIYENLDKLEPTDINDKSSLTQQSNSIRFLKKYELDSVLYEAIIVDKIPKFVFYDKDSINLVDKIEVANYTFFPADTITTHNPIPYSFESEKELQEYIELAKKETVTTLSNRLMIEYRKYVNAEEHTLTILPADTL